MPIAVNGKQFAIGKPGGYAVLDRTWTGEDRVEFRLPVDFAATLYTGADQVPGHKRYSILYGPVLMAAVGPCRHVPLPHFCQHENETYWVHIAHDPANPRKWLRSQEEQSLTYAIEGQTAACLKPYYHVDSKETFTCFPVLEPQKQE